MYCYLKVSKGIFDAITLVNQDLQGFNDNIGGTEEADSLDLN